MISRKISSNFAGLGGGGVAIGNSDTIISDTVISNNLAASKQGSAFYYAVQMYDTVAPQNDVAVIVNSIIYNTTISYFDGERCD